MTDLDIKGTTGQQSITPLIMTGLALHCIQEMFLTKPSRFESRVSMFVYSLG